MKTLPKELRFILLGAISELGGEGIAGGIYDFKNGECSCCNTPENGFYLIQGNSASNQFFDAAGRITFKHDSEKAGIVYKTIAKHFRGSGYKIVWSKDIYEVMQIEVRSNKKVTNKK